MSPELKQKFLNLACAMSPEHVSCDGELPMSKVRVRMRQYRAEWVALEKQVGRKVDENEVWGW